MTTYFNQCPNCFKLPEGGMFSSGTMKIYECGCGTKYCPRCGDRQCPNCGSKKRKEAGVCKRR